MKNFVQPGKVITVTAPYDLESGDGCLVGGIFGVACHKAASGAQVEIQTEGVVDLKKTNSVAFTQGAPVSWDNGTKLALAPASTKFPIGSAVAAAHATNDTTVRMRLNGIHTVAA